MSGLGGGRVFPVVFVGGWVVGGRGIGYVVVAVFVVVWCG